jgi:hypothetical protein
MTGIHQPWLEVAARLLERGEREAVLGDLLETGEGAWGGLLDILGELAALVGCVRTGAAWQSASDGDFRVFQFDI